MDETKWKNWLDLTKQYAAESFWKEVFNQTNQPSSQTENLGAALSTVKKESKVRSLFPPCDMYEKEDILYIQAELPGIKAEDVIVKLQGESLFIAGNYGTLQPKLQYYLKERSDRSFEKAIQLPVKVKKNAINSNLQDGVLTITLPILKEEVAVPIYIEINRSPLYSENPKQQ
ncbi:Hsp20/alpha crystallin family protein [Mesobacillus maritimus]|uniref:Hsp20/alpha crystallin family protein n=1 Tax=Mesobacillus maritimus TaxID=1643336 RepID=UPI00203C51D2|nr:Hsp20/alpha crystallin family protein [Mesobacillus maritimus]MCM3588037.1 Hsp20/alpha crystallin family protein [Mesobacillus maritimus]MCM3668368.1 Hsp20/alpha crystallin family protein [Mesobacillus maritimus]